MSNKKKPKKLRTPNLAAAGVVALAEGRGGGAETGAAVRPLTTTATEQRQAAFDYTYVRQDLRRILLLAGGLLVVLVALSFVLR
jgi:hypothetical protein